MSWGHGTCVDCGAETSKPESKRCSNCAKDHRQNGRRREAEEALRRQIEAGTLTIRQMTPEERAKWGPPRKRNAKAKRARRSRTLAVPGAKFFDVDLYEDDET